MGLVLKDSQLQIVEEMLLNWEHYHTKATIIAVFKGLNFDRDETELYLSLMEIEDERDPKKCWTEHCRGQNITLPNPFI